MLSRKDIDVKGAKNITVIAEGVKVEGNINCPGSLRIDGTVTGEITAEKEITIGKEGKVEANIRTKDAVVAGLYKGDMIASGEVEISPTGKFMGNLTQKDALLTIAKGGLFRGESLIGANAEIFKSKDEKKDIEDISLKVKKI
ncbi:MAG: polymer-forming cytoskeletal protein [Actinomycetota bacterium]|nr:polymer-forming cytoskeletal protein [Actinomycetota bacterium]